MSVTSISSGDLNESSSFRTRAPKRTISNFEDELPQNPRQKKMDIMTPELSSALDRSNVSSRNAAFIVMAVVKSLGHDPDRVNISHRLIHRDRNKMRKMMAIDIKKKNFAAENVILHWDGKLLPDCGGTQKVDRLPIVLSGLDYEQLLAVPKLNSGTGFNQAQAIVAELNRWDIVDKLKGMCFDTAYVNSGVTFLRN